MKERLNKSICIIITFILTLLIVVAATYFFQGRKGNLVLKMNTDTNNTIFTMTVDGNDIFSQATGHIIYIYIPSYVGNSVAVIDESLDGLTIDGESKGRLWKFNYNQSYICNIIYQGNEYEFPLIIRKSSFINTIFLNTESGSMNKVWEDKDHKESGNVFMYDSAGNAVYSGELEYIKGRGNSTWGEVKKPYVIKLREGVELFGMDYSKKWLLLANHSEPTKLAYKMTMDMATNLGLRETSCMEWTDLYLNGVYMGNYLVAEPISITRVDTSGVDLEELTVELNGEFKNEDYVVESNKKYYNVDKEPEENSGVYIIEKDIEAYYEGTVSGFITGEGNIFSLKYPEYATKGQIDYISKLVQNVENLIICQDEALFDYLDIETLSMRYLIDTISGNADMGITSMYFYKKPSDDKLYSGPVWDYDRSFGFFDWIIYDPDKEMKEYRGEEMITWLSYLEENQEFMEYSRDIYINRVRPYVKGLIESGLEEYSKTIISSYSMDIIRWDNPKIYYKSFDSNQRYIRFYLSKRIELLDEKYDYQGEEISFVGNGTIHKVTVICGDVIEEYGVMDGNTFDIPLELNEEKYLGWFDAASYIRYNPNIPILEDITIEALD